MRENAKITGNFGGGGSASGGTFTMVGGTVYGSDGGANANKLERVGTKQGVSLYNGMGSSAKYGNGQPIIVGDQATALYYTDDTITGHN